MFFGQLVQEFSFTDLVDIFLVFLLLYQIFVIVQGTRAVQILVGLGVIFLLFWIGLSFELNALNWILEHFFNSFFIFIVILFQDEIRQALAKFGTGRPLIFSAERARVEQDIEEISEACKNLSGDGIGGIVVLERTHGLNNYIKTGTVLDSKIHADLVYSLFQNKSPLHDGALIISKHEIKAAGCFLPLSKSSNLERNMGTRHRAAMGLAEMTDALVIAISEESSRISIFMEGKYYYIQDVTHLREVLWNILIFESHNIGETSEAL